MQISAGNASLLLVAGVAGGALNALAGGATFFTFPALLMVGLDPLSANATNFVALIPGNLAALPALRGELKRLGRALVRPLVAGGLGGLLGAFEPVRRSLKRSFNVSL